MHLYHLYTYTLIRLYAYTPIHLYTIILPAPIRNVHKGNTSLFPTNRGWDVIATA